MSPESLKYNQENLNRALQEIASYKANYGGTNIYSPVEHVLN